MWRILLLETANVIDNQDFAKRRGSYINFWLKHRKKYNRPLTPYTF